MSSERKDHRGVLQQLWDDFYILRNAFIATKNDEARDALIAFIRRIDEKKHCAIKQEMVTIIFHVLRKNGNIEKAREVISLLPRGEQRRLLHVLENGLTSVPRHATEFRLSHKPAKPGARGTVELHPPPEKPEPRTRFQNFCRRWRVRLKQFVKRLNS